MEPAETVKRKEVRKCWWCGLLVRHLKRTIDPFQGTITLECGRCGWDITLKNFKCDYVDPKEVDSSVESE